MSERKSGMMDDIVCDPGERFEEACQLMRESVAKFMNDDSSSSEDELDNDVILQRTFSQYCSNNSEDFTKAREYLFDIMTSGTLICLICIESIKRNVEVWSCKYCFGILHLHCIKKWSKDSVVNQAMVYDVNEEKFSLWRCPKCRSEYTVAAESIKYKCFCGKVENPVYDFWKVPHSCGKTCEKYLKPNCSHICSLLCHPGPCPPCPQTILISCSCFKSKPLPKRCSNKEWTCGKVCEKQLSCCVHFCEFLCHTGPCSPCKKQSKKVCVCGKNTSLQPCDRSVWHCNTVCNKLLICGNHFCQVICHEGNCPDCPNSGPRSCPCSKKQVSLQCTQTVMPCGGTCEKLLECGKHHCSQRCHFGSCEKCLQMCIKKCRCGQREKYMPCHKVFSCDIKCKRWRDCGKHFCNKKCCIGQCPPCETVCGRALNCDLHKCISICHSGPCYPCKETSTSSCNCGDTKVIIPCGRRKSSLPPRCSTDCKLPTNCHHPQRQKHLCHFGACPPCKLACGKTLNCGHTCIVNCHSAVLTKIDIKEKKSGPWDLINSYKAELIKEPCPPCLQIVSISCFGGHEILNFPCHEARVTSCGRPCGRHLLCGNHVCQIQCHEIRNNTDNNMQSEECEPCQEMCMKLRNPGCTHPCVRYCHPDDCNPCQQSTKMKCHCGINVIYVICCEWIIASDLEKDQLLSCRNRCPKQMNCGHRCNLLCHSGNCSTPENCKKKISVRCPCKHKKKEIQCFMLLKGDIPVCDEVCVKHKEMQEANKFKSDLEQIKEEKKKQEEEMLEFLRKTGGKRRKKKKSNKDCQDYPIRKNNIFPLAFTLCIIGCLLYFLISQML